MIPFLLSWSSQAFFHELLFGEAGPPFVGLAILGVEDLLHHPVAGFVAQLQEILAHQVRILGSLRLGIDGVQGKTGIAGDVELGNGQAVHVLLSLSLAGGPIELLQALGDVERHIDEHAIHIGLERIRDLLIYSGLSGNPDLTLISYVRKKTFALK